MKRSLALTMAASWLFLSGCGPEPNGPENDPATEKNRPTAATEDKTKHPDTESIEDASPNSSLPEPAAGSTQVELPDDDADGMTLYRRAQALMKAGKSEEGYAVAQKAMAQFVAEENDLAWMLLESIPLEGNRRVDVHFNMGDAERRRPEIGIVKPLSFRVWSTADAPALIEVIDFELGVINGEPSTAAIGQMTETGHANYGPLPTDSSYSDIKEVAIKTVNRNQQ